MTFLIFVGVGILIALIPALITGRIAFLTVKKYGKLGYRVFGALLALCWFGFLVEAVQYALYTPADTSEGFALAVIPLVSVPAILTFTFGVWMGLSKASNITMRESNTAVGNRIKIFKGKEIIQEADGVSVDGVLYSGEITAEKAVSASQHEWAKKALQGH